MGWYRKKLDQLHPVPLTDFPIADNVCLFYSVASLMPHDSFEFVLGKWHNVQIPPNVTSAKCKKTLFQSLWPIPFFNDNLREQMGLANAGTPPKPP